MFRFLTFLILILLIQKWLKSLQEQQKEQKKPTEEEVKDYFQTLGFPLPEERLPEPELEKPKEPVVTVKKEFEKPELKIAELEPAKIELSPQQIEEIEEQLPDFSSDKLQEGIILSEILGLPKAYQTRRGGGIG